MKQYINRERLAETFQTLCEISSPSRNEKEISEHLKALFKELGALEVYEDNSQAKTGSESGNLIIRFDGGAEAGEAVFFSCHMDTVQPGDGVKVKRDGDVFTSSGDTILGSDDKSGIAAIIELIMMINEHKLAHGLIEIIITTCEEIGLLGAKALEADKITAPYGYALDSSGIDSVIVGAPAANKLWIEIHGKAAHAGLNPEDGISAIQVASRAINNLPLGRIDEETTANMGLIEGGVAQNIVPPLVTLKGEVRSHSAEKLAKYTSIIEEEFKKTADTWETGSANDDKPSVSIQIEDEYPSLFLADDSPVIQRLHRAEEKLGKNLEFKMAGGGSDANILNSFGLPTAIIATGMDKVHTLDEQLDLNDLESLTELLLAITVAE